GYRIFRAVFFPGRRLSLEQALDRARTVNVGLQQLSFERPITLVDQQPKWYGLDPIHIRGRCLSGAYCGILRHWVDADGEEPAAHTTSIRAWNHCSWPLQYQCVFGFDRYREQPTGRLPDGTTIALY
ncbi:MAG: hypothetical protein ACREX4_16415, partial [Gammaproteobacteria bacterium]